MTPCVCHPEANDVGMGETCLNCKLYPGEHEPPGYCRNSTRQWDWYTHRKERELSLTTIQTWIENQPALNATAFTVEAQTFTGDSFEDPAAPDEIQGFVINGKVAIAQNNWGRKAGQVAFGIFEPEGSTWTFAGKHDVEWRGPKRQAKSADELGKAWAQAFHKAMVDVVSLLFEP